MADLWVLQDQSDPLAAADPLADEPGGGAVGPGGLSNATASPALIALFLGLIGFFAVFIGVAKMDPARTEPVLDSVSGAFGGIRPRPLLDATFVKSRNLAGGDADDDEPGITTGIVSRRQGPASVTVERLPEVELPGDALFDRLGRVRRERLMQLGRLADAVSASLENGAPLVMEIVGPVPRDAGGREIVAIFQRLAALDEQVRSFGLDAGAIRLGSMVRDDERWRLRLIDRRAIAPRPDLAAEHP